MRYARLHILGSIEAFVLYTVLLTGALVFGFPFIWMVATSFKTTDETGGRGAAFWPALPRPSKITPYIDDRAYEQPTQMEGTRIDDWPELELELTHLFQNRIDAWLRQRVDAKKSEWYRHLNQQSCMDEMTEALFELLNVRISDRARSAGTRAVLQESDRVVDKVALDRAWDSVLRRVSLGPVRVRTRDFQVQKAAQGHDWRVAHGWAQLVEDDLLDPVYPTLEARFDSDSRRIRLRLGLSDVADPESVDQIMVSYRSDGSWARIVFEVARGGRLYRTKDVINLPDDRWREVHLRWPEERIDPVQRRTFYRMQEVGPSDTEAFRIDMILMQNSAWGACLDKALHQYRNVFRGIPFARYIMTSLSLSILSIVLMIFSCSLAAYAFARLRWPGRDTFFLVMLATMMIPPQVTMIPAFLIFKWIGWYDTLLPLWVPAAFGAPFFIFLLRQFLKTIPDDLEDAARIDGCGFLRVYWHVMLPLIIPTLAIIAVYTFSATWNNFMGPLIYVNDDRLFPLALGLFKFNLRAGPDAGLVMAASFVMTLPVIVLFFFLQRYFIQGVTLTGMKG